MVVLEHRDPPDMAGFFFAVGRQSSKRIGTGWGVEEDYLFEELLYSDVSTYVM